MSLFKDLSKKLQTQSTRNMIVRVVQYHDCDVKDPSANTLVGIDMATGDAVAVQMSNDANPGKTIYEMCHGAASQRIPKGGTVIFTGVIDAGMAGGMRRLRAASSVPAISEFLRDLGDGGIMYDKEGVPCLDGHILWNVMAKVSPVRTDDKGRKSMQRVDIVIPDQAVHIKSRDEFVAKLTDMLGKNAGRPVATLRIMNPADGSKIVKTISGFKGQTPEDTVKNYLENDEFGKNLIGALEANSKLEGSILELIPGARFYFSPAAVRDEYEKIAANEKRVLEGKQPLKTRSSPYTIEREEGASVGNGYARSIVTLRAVREGAELKYLVANALPTESRPDVQMLEEVRTPYIYPGATYEVAARKEKSAEPSPLIPPARPEAAVSDDKANVVDVWLGGKKIATVPSSQRAEI
jgi:hypothetical protein